MPDGDDIRNLVNQARMQNQEFMMQARQQMVQQLEAQRYQIAQSAGPAGAAAITGMGYPQAGSPAGRLLETITTLVQRGASTVGGVGSAAWGGAMGITATAGQIAGSGGAFMAVPGAPYGPMGIGGGMLSPTAQTQMTAFQSLFTAYGGDLPFGLGKYAAQRMDMTRQQAQIMAQEEIGSRLSGGWRRGVFGVANVLTLGAVGLRARMTGEEMGFWRAEEVARNLQGQLRHLTRQDLEAGGLAGRGGPFVTGITREGAREFAREYAAEMGTFQREMGLTAEEVGVLGGRAMGTMGRVGIAGAVRQGGTRGLATEVRRQAEFVREIQQSLHLSEQEAEQFFSAIGQMHGTAERIAGIARGAIGMAGRLGLSTREIVEPILQTERTAMQMGLGRARGGAIAQQYMETLYSQFRRGGISAEQMMMYGGRTPEEALQFQIQTRMQQNLGMWAGGRGLMGVGTLVTPGPGPGVEQWARFMAGGAGLVETMGAVGGRMARDPFAQMRARFDPATSERMGMSAERAAFRLAEQAVGQMTWLNPADKQAMLLDRFAAISGLGDQEARTRAEQIQGETLITTSIARQGKWNWKGTEKQNAQGILSVYNRIVGEGLTQEIINATGAEDAYSAAAQIYARATNNGETPLDPSKSVSDLMVSGLTLTGTPDIEAAIGLAQMEAETAGGQLGTRGRRLSDADREAIARRVRERISRTGAGAFHTRGVLELGRRRELIGRLFGGVGAEAPELRTGAAPTNLLEFARSMADIDVSGVSGTRNMVNRLNLQGLQRFSEIYATKGEDFRLQAGAGRITDLVGVETLSRILSQAGYSYSTTEVERILGGKGTEGEMARFRGVLEKTPVVEEIALRALRSTDSVKLPPIGTSGNPVYIRPSTEAADVGLWKKMLSGLQRLSE